MEITTIKEARENVGKRVTWEERRTPHYVTICFGTIEEVFKRQIQIRGEFKSLSDYYKLSTMEDDG